MKKFYVQVLIFLLSFLFIIDGCSSSKLSSSLKEDKIQQNDEIEKYLPEDITFFSISDTSQLKKEIESKLEKARQHYLTALESFQNNDSTTAVSEFEKAIDVLDQLSYYPDIENNEEFTELSKSLIEDYEKLIISIDELEPDTPIFALREKINAEASIIDVSKENLHLPKELPKTQVPLIINEPVKQFLYYFMTKGQKFLPTWFYRSGYYFPMMKRIFAEEGLPQELIYLSLIESGLNPAARSIASAVGLWQFIKSTGKLYDLHSDFWVDDRRNPEKATRAAAKHLKDLYEIYQDWYLVLAAYNSGGGRVNSAIRRAGSNDYWEISPKLPYETRGYVPQYIAISLIFMNPEEYGFTNIDYAQPLQCDTIITNECYDLDVIANFSGVDKDVLKLMNPELVQGCTPPSTSYALKVPKDKTEVIAACIKDIPPEKRRTFAIHIVKKGETITSISKKYNISKSLLADVNGLEKYLRNKKRLPRGIALKIPLRENNSFAINLSRPKENENDTDDDADLQTNNSPNKLQEQSNKVKIIHHIKEGDNLKTIASMYDVRISDIRNWNDIPFGQEISDLDTIEIYVPKSKYSLYSKINELNLSEKNKLLSTKNTIKTEVEKRWFTHKVKKNETLSNIADKYNISIAAIKKWNNLKSNKISYGKVLKLYANQPVSSQYADKTTKIISSTHEVQKNETYYSIAKKYNLTTKDLLELNNLQENDKLKVGQKLVVSKKENQEKNNLTFTDTKIEHNNSEKHLKEPTFTNYKVKKGDNLYSIASAYNVKVEDIKKWNNINDNTIKPGQTLKLHSESIVSSKGDNDKTKTSPKREIYKVKRGDTLYSISKRFNVEISELKKWNQIKELKAGDKIVVYR